MISRVVTSSPSVAIAKRDIEVKRERIIKIAIVASLAAFFKFLFFIELG